MRRSQGCETRTTVLVNKAFEAPRHSPRILAYIKRQVLLTAYSLSLSLSLSSHVSKASVCIYIRMECKCSKLYKFTVEETDVGLKQCRTFFY